MVLHHQNKGDLPQMTTSGQSPHAERDRLEHLLECRPILLVERTPAHHNMAHRTLSLQAFKNRPMAHLGQHPVSYSDQTDASGQPQSRAQRQEPFPLVAPQEEGIQPLHLSLEIAYIHHD